MAERNIDVRVRLLGGDQFKRDMGNVTGALEWLDVTAGVLASQVIQRGFQMIASAIGDSIDKNIAFESAMASLRKTAGLTETGMQNMASQIMDMSERLPMSSEEIAGLADTVAHLGLRGKDLLPFTETMIALGAATDMSAEEAATALARLVNVMGTSGDEYERLGSTIFALGRTSATTESEITAMTQKMAGSAALLGFSEANALGFAAALSSVGVQSNLGANMIQKLGTNIELMVSSGSEDLENFANVAGMSAEEFSESWRADPARTLAAFITGLGDVSEEGGSAIQTLNNLGIKEVRLLRTVSSLAAAGDLLTRSLDTADKAWEENAELTNATGIAYGTTAAKIQMAENAIANAKIAVGEDLAGAKLTVKEFEADTAKGLRDLIMDDSLGKQIGEITERYDDIGNALSTTRDQALVLIDALETLGDPSTLNAEELQNYEAIMSALDNIMPGIASGYDNVTRSIKGGTQGLRDYAEQQYNIAHSANEVNRASEALEAYSAKEEAYNELLIKQAEAYSKRQAAWQAYLAAEEEANKNGNITDMSQTQEWRTYHEADVEWADVSSQVSEARDYLDQYAHIADDATTATENLNSAMSGTGGAANDVDKTLALMELSLEGYAEEAAQVLQDFETAYIDAKKTVDSLFKSVTRGFDMESKTEAKDVEESLDKQIEYIEEYMQNLEKVKELGLSDELIAQLSDGSESSAQILRGLAESNEEEINKINEKYDTVQQHKDAMATAMAEAATSASSKMEEIETAVNDMVSNADQATQAQANMSDTIQGLINGINGKISTLRTKVSEVETLSKKVANADTGGTTGGSHAAGLTYVPYDGYLAQLHRGERVLTALEAKAYRQEQLTSSRISAASRGGTDNRRYSTMNNNMTVKFGDVHVRSEADIEELSEKLATLNRRKHRGVGVIA